ncbi:MAG: hypothetical protein GY868_07440 [Deltaproteobacteria bacterium]|nr:hypothetical protein [Deltaproteobacteria bacterium]
MGWISFACDDCGAANYGVSIDGDGQFDGYAWSKNIGWINFALLNRPDAAVKTSWPDGPSPCDPANAQCEDDSDCDPGEACHNCICSPVTFAEEIEFNVIPGSRAVTLAWTAVSEEDVLGYNILRRARRGGVRVQINDQLIPGTGSVETTVDYEFVDDAVQNRRTYQYTLVEVETDGGTREHGPVSATPRLLYGIGR